MADAPEGQPAASTTPPDRELPDSLKVLVTDEVCRLFAQEHARYWQVATAAKKTVGVGVAMLGVLLAFLGFLGFKTCADIKHETVVIITQRVDGLIQGADAETGVKRNLDRLVNRSIVTATLIAMKSPEAPPAQPGQSARLGVQAAEVSLPRNEWLRLREWIKDENLGLQDFTDVLRILAAQEDSRRSQDANLLLAEMLNPPDSSRYRWMLHQPEKRLAILDGFRQREMGAAALQIARSDANSDAMRIAAVKYLKSLHDTEAFDGLMKMTAGAAEDDLGEQALLAGASLRPADKKIAGAVNAILSAPVTYRSAGLAIKLATEIWYAPTADDCRVCALGSDRQARSTLAGALLSFAFAHGAYVVVLSGGRISLMVPAADNAGEAYGMLKKDFSQLSPYWDLLNAAANRGNVSQLEHLAPVEAYFKQLRVLRMKLSPPSRVTVSGNVLDGSRVAEVGLARPELAGPDRRRGHEILVVQWRDQAGHERESPLRELRGGGFELSLADEVSALTKPD